MRSRLTVAFGLLVLLVVTAFMAFRLVSINDLAEQDVRRQVQRESLVLATLLSQGLADTTQSPSAAALAPFAMPDRHVTVTFADQGSTQVTGEEWIASDDRDALTGSASVDRVTVQIRAPMRKVDQDVAYALPSLLALGVGLVAFAAILGAGVARLLSRPFAQLAVAANALARGRSDLSLPQTRIAEARAISLALEGGAAQLGESLRRERDLALRASHELRTPLTSLRLALHDLTDRDDTPADLIEAAEQAARQVDRLDQAVDAVLDETRRHPVLAGAQLPLGLVVPALAQRWADTLALADVALEAELLGDPDREVTPGPLEQLLDEVLAAVLACRGQAVRLVVDEAERHLRITVTVDSSAASDTDATSASLARARAVIETLGGRMSGDLTSAGGLVVVVLRR